MIRKILATLTLMPLLLLQSNAMAADDSTFAGSYLGIFGGAAGAGFAGMTDSDELNDGDNEDAEAYGHKMKHKGTYGFYLGYNAVRDGLLFGLEADIGSAGMQAKAIDDDTTDFSTHKILGTSSVRARVGVLATNNTLLFATAGLGVIRSKFTGFNDMEDVDAESKSVRLNSITSVVGMGLEHKFNAGLSFRLEGLYYAPGRKHNFVENQLHDDIDNGDYAQTDGLYQVRAGLAYHF